ncbi:bacteriohemerythrin [Maridesulfovibrio zosterae]|uniref:bacteriohemerythrin n=1 Tax=Maridesulfovibrio zosterae TaxID=82171 RepID=UPI000420D96A|nr:bacteriohemerythrin [Maridesulfovibrio zosterae]
MGTLEWHDGLNLGVKEIDDQHKELISIINKVLKAFKDGENEKSIDLLLKQLREYTIHHFSSEEKYMEKIDYPDFNEHRQLHRQLKERVKSLQSARFHKEDIEIDQIKALLSKWLIHHILREDYKIAQYAKNAGPQF